MKYDLVVVGGGAAGFFAAINSAMLNPGFKIIILEKSNRVLQKVKISGGGRCNVTNVVSVPSLLSKNYPRGKDHLEQPFNSFTSADTVNWFKQKGVALKTEKDGRIFPISDSSQTIIDCFINLCSKYKITVKKSTEVKSFTKNENHWEVEANDILFKTNNLLIATGNTPSFWNRLENKGYGVAKPVPSLFTFTVKQKEITELSGLSVQSANVRIKNTAYVQNGPLLITHWGYSGPSILKLSSQAAVYLHENQYNFKLIINWLNIDKKEIIKLLKSLSSEQSKKNILSHNPFKLPVRLWKFLCQKAGIRQFQNWAECGKKQHEKLSSVLTCDTYDIIGKSTNKDEFVTAGGILLNDIDLITYEHKLYEGLFFAGEVLNIDGYTGGFNFQAAWTSGYLVAQALTFKQKEVT